MTCSPFFMAVDDLKRQIDLIVQIGAGVIKANQGCESLCFGRLPLGCCQDSVHCTNHVFWDLSLAGSVPCKALVQRCLQPPADPLQPPDPQVLLHDPSAPADLSMGGIHHDVVASSQGADHRFMKQRLQF